MAIGLALLAFIAIRGYLREAGEERWSAPALPFIVIGSTMLIMRFPMELAPLAAAEIGADVQAAQEALTSMTWFLPFLMVGNVVFALGILGFAMGIVRSTILSPGLAWLVVGALVAMLVMLFLPWGVSNYVGGAAAIVALWPIAYQMWTHPEAKPMGEAQAMPAV